MLTGRPHIDTGREVVVKHASEEAATPGYVYVDRSQDPALAAAEEVVVERVVLSAPITSHPA